MTQLVKPLLVLLFVTMLLTSDTTMSSTAQAQSSNSLTYVSPGSFEPGTLNLELRAKLIELLAELRSQWPSAKILGISEIGFGTLNFEPGTRGVIRPNDAMNQIRRALSELP